MTTIERVKAFMQREIVPNRYAEGAETAFFGCCFALLSVKLFQFQGITAGSMVFSVVAAGFFVAAWAIATGRAWGYLLKCLTQALLATAFLTARNYFLFAYIAYFSYQNWRQYSYLRELRAWTSSHRA